MLRGLAGARQEREQICRTPRSFDLGQADVSGNNGQEVVKIVGDSSRQRPERFQLAGGQPLFFDPLSIGHVS